MKWKNIGKKGALGFIIVALLITVAPLIMSKQVKASSNTIYVPDNHTKIQWGVDNATEGDTIIVDASGGPYYESVVVDKQLNLTGIGMPVVDAEGCGDVIRITADSCVFAGFEVVNSEWASGIKVESNGNVIKNNIISGNCYGIHLLDSSNNEITRNNVSNNDFGIYISKTEISAAIGPEGGIIEVTNPNSSLYGLKVEIPAGALDDATDIKLRPISQEELEKEMKVCYTGSAYDFLKAIHLDAGGATFKKPINVTISKPLNVSENGSILVAQIFPDVDNNTKPDLILVDIGSVEGEFVVGSSSVEKGLAQVSCLPVPGITQGGTLAFLYQGETIFLTGRVVDSMGSPLGSSIVTSLQSGGVKAISQANGEYALNVHFFGSGEQKIVAVGYAPNLRLYAIQPLTISVPLPPPGVVFPCPDMTIDLLKDEAEEKLKTESEALPKTVCDDIRYLSFVMGVVNKAADELKYVGNIFEDSLKASKIPFNPDEVNIHPGEEVTLEGDFSSILGVKKPVEYSVVKTMPPIVGAIPENENLQIKICGCELSIIGIGSSVKDESVATIVDTEDPTKEDPTYMVTVKGGDEGTTEITGDVKKLSVSFDVNFGRVIVDVGECEMRFIPEWGLDIKPDDPSIDILGPATINVGCFPEDHFNDTEYEDSNQDWDGDGELDGTDKNGDTYEDKQITWHAERGHVVCEDFSINSEGYTLTIEPGAEVTFVKGATLEAEEDGGVLIAEGTEDQKIVFREFGGGNYPPGLWTIINIESDGSRFSYCSVEQGVAVYLDDVCLEVSHCTFSDTTVYVFGSSPTITENTFCDDGSIDINGGDEECSPSITKNTIAGSIIVRTHVDGSPNITGNDISDTQVGIFAWGGSPIITENTISDCNAVGISVSHDGSPTIMGNTISNSLDHGIMVSRGSPGDIIGNNISGNGFGISFGGFLGTGYSSTISGNTISGSKKGYGIVGGDSLIISGNNISGNCGEGIAVDGSSIVSKNTISCNYGGGIAVFGSSIVSENTISCNGHDGIAVDGSPTITGNNITGNEDAGIDVKCGSPTITGNTILGNGWCGIYAPDASPTIAENDICGNGEDCSECGGEDQAPCECWECIHGASSEVGVYRYAKTANNMESISAGNYYQLKSKINVELDENMTEKDTISDGGYTGSMSSTSNIIYLNNFIDNGRNVVTSKSTNIWNSTEKITYIYNGSNYTNYLGNYWDDYKGVDVDGDGIGDSPYSIDANNDCYPLMEPLENYFAPTGNIFDTGKGTYPSISGTHNGTIKQNQTITVKKLYTYSCVGTGGHTKYAKIWNNTGWNVTAHWSGYVEDWHNITFDDTFTLYKNKTYNYTIHTGSYPQIIHTDEWEAEGGMGIINCTSFVDVNGKIYKDWIPAIRLGAG